MGLTKTQAAIWQKARSLGSGSQAVGLSDPACAYLIGRIAHDLGLLSEFPEVAEDLPPFFTKEPLVSLGINASDSKVMFERLVLADPDADTYFACLAALHKSRLKYEQILGTQSLPTLEQVGPRGLLQYGKLAGDSLTAFLIWRKWFFDIDNRAGQETGYLFEPIIAYAIGGIPAPARKSPVRRQSDQKKGRQVDCILDDRAYEFKIRVTIAASGQGRWQEELDFPNDCKSSGFIPVLVCMDSTPNAKLDSLISAFQNVGGQAFIGEAAWQHLEDKAGATMSIFLENYVRRPIQNLLEKADLPLPDLIASWSDQAINIVIGNDSLYIERELGATFESAVEEMPDDAEDEISTG